MGECPACGASLDVDVAECPSCGASVAGATESFEPVGAEEATQVAQVPGAEGPVLVVRKGPQPGERFFIDTPRLSIGRDPASDIFLNDMTVSRTHAIIECVGSRVKLTDAGSLNGTYVNGELVEAAELSNGDTVQIGTFQMAFACASRGEDS
jgi:pSer/pThr/pTyr-binding forkhead associated (FHA) protein